MRKKILLKIILTGYCLLALCHGLYAQVDSLQANRYVTRATMYGIGYTNIFDTYLSPQEYKGIDFRISRETMRMTKLLNGKVSVQNFFQANIGYTHNRVDNNNTFAGLVNWNYGFITNSASQKTLSCWQGLWQTLTEDLYTICAIPIIRHQHGHFSISTLPEWQSGMPK